MMVNMAEAEWDAVIKVHLKGTFAPTHFAAEHFRERSKAGDDVQGRIINTTSPSGLFGNVGQTNYGAAKAGIAAFTVIAAMELGRYGVTVNAIAPTALTRMTEDLGRHGRGRRGNEEGPGPRTHRARSPSGSAAPPRPASPGASSVSGARGSPSPKAGRTARSSRVTASGSRQPCPRSCPASSPKRLPTPRCTAPDPRAQATRRRSGGDAEPVQPVATDGVAAYQQVQLLLGQSGFDERSSPPPRGCSATSSLHAGSRPRT